MRNITADCPAPRFLKTDISTMPPRGVEDCICQGVGDKRKDFVLIADRFGVVVWYARNECPIHGLKAQDCPETPLNEDSSTG